ncbi:NnrS family protein [Albidovulum sp.]|uniref:NnrS family protein n=1 Tax=Albidovulum sp. TaxID=1872424 RepID=UPI0035289FAF
MSAVIAGFLTTAVSNRTGRLPVVGWRLVGLAAMWLIGRVAIPFWPVSRPLRLPSSTSPCPWRRPGCSRARSSQAGTGAP